MLQTLKFSLKSIQPDQKRILFGSMHQCYCSNAISTDDFVTNICCTTMVKGNPHFLINQDSGKVEVEVHGLHAEKEQQEKYLVDGGKEKELLKS